MAIKAAFIGINKHQDDRVFDLMGARKDAEALWALFTDTIPDIETSPFISHIAVECIRKTNYI